MPYWPHPVTTTRSTSRNQQTRRNWGCDRTIGTIATIDRNKIHTCGRGYLVEFATSLDLSTTPPPMRKRSKRSLKPFPSPISKMQPQPREITSEGKTLNPSTALATTQCPEARKDEPTTRNRSSKKERGTSYKTWHCKVPKRSLENREITYNGIWYKKPKTSNWAPPLPCCHLQTNLQSLEKDF